MTALSNLPDDVMTSRAAATAVSGRRVRGCPIAYGRLSLTPPLVSATLETSATTVTRPTNAPGAGLASITGGANTIARFRYLIGVGWGNPNSSTPRANPAGRSDIRRVTVNGHQLHPNPTPANGTDVRPWMLWMLPAGVEGRVNGLVELVLWTGGGEYGSAWDTRRHPTLRVDVFGNRVVGPQDFQAGRTATVNRWPTPFLPWVLLDYLTSGGGAALYGPRLTAAHIDLQSFIDVSPINAPGVMPSRGSPTAEQSAYYGATRTWAEWRTAINYGSNPKGYASSDPGYSDLFIHREDFNGLLDTARSHRQNVDAILSGMPGWFLALHQGKITLVPPSGFAAPAPPAANVLSVREEPPRSEPSVVSVTYARVTDGEPVEVSVRPDSWSGVAPSHDESTTRLNAQGLNDPFLAASVAMRTALAARRTRHRVTADRRAATVKPGTRWTIGGKDLVVEAVDNADLAQGGTVALDMVERDPAIDWPQPILIPWASAAAPPLRAPNTQAFPPPRRTLSTSFTMKARARGDKDVSFQPVGSAANLIPVVFLQHPQYGEAWISRIHGDWSEKRIRIWLSYRASPAANVASPFPEEPDIASPAYIRQLYTGRGNTQIRFTTSSGSGLGSPLTVRPTTAGLQTVSPGSAPLLFQFALVDATDTPGDQNVQDWIDAMRADGLSSNEDHQTRITLHIL